MRALYCLSFGCKKEYVETDLKPVEYQLGTALITFLSTDFDRLRAKLRERQTPMMENAAITEVKNELIAAHPFLERFVQSLFLKKTYLMHLMNGCQALRNCKKSFLLLLIPCFC
ncbi:MAG: hypothetical protein ACLSB9_34070 [Hydrogeniiclostridium mannosilyticum]